MSAPTPGLPDPELVRGDWTGEKAARSEREALAYRECRARLRTLHSRLAERRAYWSESLVPCSNARAVAYQSVMGDISAILSAVESIVDGA